jgi:SnoaL-like domain
MPWFPDFANAAELARKQTRATDWADPVGQYLAALNTGDARVLEEGWPGKVVVYDPRVGEVRGHRHLRRFVRRSQSLLAERHARIETVASTVVPGRAVVELLAHLSHDGEEQAWPVTVVAESSDDGSVVFRSYFSRWPIDGERHVRPPILDPGPARLTDVVGRHQAALAAGDAEAVVSTFAPDGYFREPIGPDHTHRGPAELRSFFRGYFSAGGGIGLEPCAVTDDGVRCALEYNVVRWGEHDLPPQAGVAVYERGADGLLAAARVYDDVTPPVESGPSVSVAVVTSRTEAELIAGLLRSHGLPSTVSSDDAGGQEPQLQLQGVRVQVARADETAARRLLATTDDNAGPVGG